MVHRHALLHRLYPTHTCTCRGVLFNLLSDFVIWTGYLGDCELYFAHVGTIKRKAKTPVVLERIWTKIQFKDTYVFLSTCKQPRGEDSCPLLSVRPPGSEHPRPSRSTIQIRDGQKKELTIKVRVQQPYSPGNPLPKPELMFLAVFGKL